MEAAQYSCTTARRGQVGSEVIEARLHMRRARFRDGHRGANIRMKSNRARLERSKQTEPSRHAGCQVSALAA